MTSSPPKEPPAGKINRLLEVMRRLRDPDHGCPWDNQQTYSTIARFTIEEAYEVLDSIQQNDLSSLEEELGDLLFQVVFLSQIASENGTFDFDQVTQKITEKMISRHPHVFLDKEIRSDGDQTRSWEDIKEIERATKGKFSGTISGVALALPALMRAQKLQKRASRQGFDWEKISQVFTKLEEEIGELKTAIETKNFDDIKEEVGDLLFTCVNISRHAGIDAEEALRGSNEKFISRFNRVETATKDEGIEMKELSLCELEKLWASAKRAERKCVS